MLLPIIIGGLLGLPAAGPSWSVGAARVDVTPEGPIRLSGYGSRREEATNVARPLSAKALALAWGDGPPLVLVTVENCGVPAEMVEEVAARLAEADGLPRDRLAVASTHTHTGPCLSGPLPLLFGEPLPPDQRDRVDRYTRLLTDRIEAVAREAIAHRAPARLAWGRGRVGFAANRRVLEDGKWVGFGVNPDGPVDRSLDLLHALDADGKPIATLVATACHCTTLGGEFNEVCGDWAGYAMEAIERDQPGGLALVAIGCGADANPEPRGALEMAKAHGEEVAAEARRLLDAGLEPLSGPVVARLTRVELPFAPIPTRREFEEKAGQEGSVGLHARAQLARLDRGEALPTTLSYPIQAWAFGEGLCMVSLAGEVVVDYALRLKRELDGDRLWINAYTNDVPCYIPSARVLGEGGYEADFSMIYYDRPTRFAPEVEDRIVEAVRDLVPPAFRRPE